MERSAWHQQNLKKVVDALFELGAVHLANIPGPGKQGCLDFYSVNGRVLIVQEYANESGLEVFRLLVPTTSSAKMPDVIESIVRYAEGADAQTISS